MTLTTDPQHALSGGVIDFATAAYASLSDLRNRVGLDAWSVARRDGDDFVVLASVGTDPGPSLGVTQRWEDALSARMLDGTGPMVAADVEQQPDHELAPASSGIRVKSYLGAPISAPDGSVLGALYGIGLQAQTVDLADALPAVEVQAAMLGLLLSHELRMADDARLRERTQVGSRADAVTGACDRTAWDAALTDEEARARLYAGSASILVIDLEMLRQVNETLGHPAGDKLLQRTAALLRGSMRSTDLLARLGGSQFGVLLPLTDGTGARLLADHLKHLLAKSDIGASVGAGSRHCDEGLVHAWREADADMVADKVQRATQRLAHSEHSVDLALPTMMSARTERTEPGSPTASDSNDVDAGTPAPTEAPVTEGSATRGTGSVDALLRLARDQLGMDVAFLSVFEGDHRRIRNAQSNIALPVRPGFVEPSDQSHCRLIADGRVGEVTPDALAVPLFAALPVTKALGIRAFVGVPIHRRSGDLYGTLCAFSLKPDDTLHARDAGVLHQLGEIAMDLVEVEDRHDGARHDIIARLDQIHAAGGPLPVYQPVVTLDRLEVVGFEALSRFPGSDRNPAEWFADASSAGLGTELELRALSNAVRALPEIDGFLAVNISPATMLTPGFGRQLAPLPLDRMILELTEHEPIRDYDAVTATLLPLRARGLRVAVDDAGAGFASMAHILALVPDMIKLDISLVRGIDRDLGRQALAAALTAFADKTCAGVIAEGVETEAELSTLRELGIEFGQGYHLGRPAPLPVRRPSLGSDPVSAL